MGLDKIDLETSIDQAPNYKGPALTLALSVQRLLKLAKDQKRWKGKRMYFWAEELYSIFPEVQEWHRLRKEQQVQLCLRWALPAWEAVGILRYEGVLNERQYSITQGSLKKLEASVVAMESIRRRFVQRYP